MGWILVHEPDEPPVVWQCAVCEAPAGTPHAEGCKCTLMVGVEIEDATIIEGEGDGIE